MMGLNRLSAVTMKRAGSTAIEAAAALVQAASWYVIVAP